MHTEIQRIIQQHFHASQQMQLLKPSTITVAIWRAAHQLIDNPPLFVDPIATRILGETWREITANIDKHKDLLSTAMRIAIAARSRFAEDELALSNATQYVILGAGLDTYAYRSQKVSERVFEVDHPGVQTIKQKMLDQNHITPTVSVVYVGCDFEKDALASCLAEAGFDSNKKTYFSLLGVIPYLTESAIKETLRFVARCAPESRLVFDYIVDPGLLSEIENSVLQTLGTQLAATGEPLQTFLSPGKVNEILVETGFKQAQDIDANYLNQRYLSEFDYGVKVGRVTRMALAVV